MVGRPGGIALALSVASLALLLASCASPEAPAADAAGSATGFEGLAASLLAASDGASLLCFGEVHGSTADADLRSALVSHPEFSERFGQVLFEGASAAHQELIDRYVLEGEDVARERLARVWRDAGRGLQWRLPLYERLFDELRALNRGLPADRRVRLLGGTPPIPWDVVQTPDELAPWIDREEWLHQRMRELLGTDRATLGIYGRHHCERLRFHDDAELEIAMISALSVGPSEDAEFRRLMGLETVDAALVAIDELRGQRLVREIWGDGHLYRGSRFGELADAVVSFGELDHRVLVVREQDLPESERVELRRRDRLMAAALSSTPTAAEP